MYSRIARDSESLPLEIGAMYCCALQNHGRDSAEFPLNFGPLVRFAGPNRFLDADTLEPVIVDWDVLVRQNAPVIPLPVPPQVDESAPEQLLASLRYQAHTRQIERPDDCAYLARSYFDDSQSDTDTLLSILIERAVVRRTVADILAMKGPSGPAFCLSLSGPAQSTLASRDQDAIMAAIMTHDVDSLTVHCDGTDQGARHVGRIVLVYRKGPAYVISAYSSALRDVVTGANELARALSELL